jgi:hypothetical protein
MPTLKAMNYKASTSARSDRKTQQLAGPEAEARAAQLRAANINPRTGLATDYLNHFNEAIMLLEMIPDIPECAEDFLLWQPLSYCEHFMASSFKARDLAIAAYESADLDIRFEFEQITDTMTSILTALSAAMRDSTLDTTRAKLAQQAVGWLKPLVVAASGVIHGDSVPDTGGSEANVDYILNH